MSLGWNDTPCGAESCIRRNLYDLIRNHDKDAYSEYELYDEEFRKELYDDADFRKVDRIEGQVLRYGLLV